MKQKHRLAPRPLQPGQIWKMDEADLHIEEVGKRLVHYKLFRGKARRVPISLSGKEAVEKYLEENGAVLVQKSVTRKPMKTAALRLLLLLLVALLLPGCI